ncbi:MAG: hypothetical protein AAFZ09_20020, partial [Pseudomonadota bacterium]
VEIESVGWSRLFEDTREAPAPGSMHLLGEFFVPRLPKALDEHIFFDVDPMDGSPRRTEGQEGRPTQFADVFDYAACERDVLAPILKAVRQCVLTGLWDDQFRMNYDVLLALQALKRNVVIDKLHLFWWAWRGLVDGGLPRGAASKGSSSGQGSGSFDGKYPAAGTRRAQFYIARAGALGNLRTYVSRLADYHAQFEKTLDLGLQDNHRPITGRRREQGLYHFVLAEQTRELYDDTAVLMTRLLNPTEVRASSGGGKNGQMELKAIGRGSPVVIHRWQHDFTSTNADLLD